MPRIFDDFETIFDDLGGTYDGYMVDPERDPNDLYYNEYYLYSLKHTELAAAGVIEHTLASGVMQNAPIVVTATTLQKAAPSDSWAQVNGLGKYDKRGYNDFTLLPDGNPDPGEREFALHPDASGKIVFNQPLLEDVFIEYEAGPSGYYILNSIDLNPVRNQIDSGFLHLSVSSQPKSLFLSTTHSTLVADGIHFTRIVATLYDANNDTVPNEDLIFYLPDDILGQLTPDKGTAIAVGPSGHTTQVRERTNNKGKARTIYTPIKTQSGTQVIKVFYELNPLVYNYISINQTYTVESPFTLDVSLLDSLDYLT